MPRRKAGEPVPVGKKIKQARTKKKITLNNLANDTGFSVDFIKKIEAGKAIPPVGALLQIARALEIDSALFLKDQDARMSKRIKAYTKRTDNYAYETLPPGAENKHLKAFKVSVEAGKDHTGVGYQHEGEEFVYVLAGKIDIIVGDHVNRLKAGDSLHFNSGIRHQMKNVADVTTELLVVIYGP